MDITVSDVVKGKPELIAENALLRQQLIVVKRQIKQPQLKGCDRLLLVLLASKVRTWRQALLLDKPETVLKWHRELFRLVWKHKTTTQDRKPRVAVCTRLPKTPVCDTLQTLVDESDGPANRAVISKWASPTFFVCRDRWTGGNGFEPGFETNAFRLAP